MNLTSANKNAGNVGRRDFLRVGMVGVGGLGLTLGDFFAMQAKGDQKNYISKEGVAKSVIQIVLPGGMAHQESWDPKPEAPLEYRGPFGVAKTKMPDLNTVDIESAVSQVMGTARSMGLEVNG